MDRGILPGRHAKPYQYSQCVQM